MGADNWAVCPRCHKKHVGDLAEEHARVKAAYGVVSVDEFDAMREAYEANLQEREPPTFREDWEIGIGTDEVIVRYSGRCQTCQLTVKFNDDRSIEF